MERHRRLLKIHRQQQRGYSQRSEADILRDHHRFLRDADDDDADADTGFVAGPVEAWERRLAKKYYESLWREYAIADLSRPGAVGFRWRIEREVVAGKGQHSCGERRCHQLDGLESFEVNFEYREDGKDKNALVKVRLCPTCADKLAAARGGRPPARARDRDLDCGRDSTSGCAQSRDRDRDRDRDHRQREGLGALLP